MKRILIFLFSFNAFSATAQLYEQEQRYFFWPFNSENTTIYGISFDDLNSDGQAKFVRTNGLRLELLGLGVLLPAANGSPITGADTIIYTSHFCEEIVNGLSISTGSFGDFSYNGVAISVTAQYGPELNGIALAGISNSMDMVNGLQATALQNEALLCNGLQIGARNFAIKLRGVQIGLFNKSNDTRGFQIGLWNVNEKRKWPIFNWKLLPNSTGTKRP